MEALELSNLVSLVSPVGFLRAIKADFTVIGSQGFFCNNGLKSDILSLKKAN